MATRLATEFSDLDAAIEAADRPTRQRVAAAVASAAVQAVDLDDETVLRALERVCRGEAVDGAVREEVEKVVMRIDEQYWDLSETGSPGDPPKADAAFRKARAATAVLYASSTGLEAAAEATYEAHHAMRDPVRLRAIVESSLSEGG